MQTLQVHVAYSGWRLYTALFSVITAIYGALKSEGAVASVEDAAGACLREQEVVAAGGPDKRLAVGDVMEVEEEDGFLAPEDEVDEDVFEADVGDEYAEMEEEEEVMFVRTLPSAAESARNAAPAAAVSLNGTPIGVSTPAAASAVELSEEQKERIARNRQLAMQRLAEREAAKAAENAAALGGGEDAIQPTAPSPLAAVCSPAPSAPCSRYGSPRYVYTHTRPLVYASSLLCLCVLLSLALYFCLRHSRHSLLFSSQAID